MTSSRVDDDRRATLPDPRRVSLSPPADDTLDELPFSRRYELSGSLGEGGMGEVRIYRGERPRAGCSSPEVRAGRDPAAWGRSGASTSTPGSCDSSCLRRTGRS